MEADKENVRCKVKSKIPLPLKPLPALPKHLLNKHGKIETQRYPLKILSQTNIYPSSSKQDKNRIEGKSKIQFEVKVDAKYVTMRKKTEDLDWDYKIFKDKNVNIEFDDESKENVDIDQSVKSSKTLAFTPKKSPVQRTSARNIKRSLKRPHSRELQGLTPPVKEQMMEEHKVKRQLEFKESVQETLNTPDFWKRSYMTCLNRDYTSDILGYLLKVEQKSLAFPDIPRITRACVINWLMKVNGSSGNPAVIQAACWYLDSVLGIGHVQLDKLQLIAAACYWIAQKLHGSVAPATMLVKYTNNAFSSKKLLAAEKAVLKELNFPAQPVVPQEFITYLAWWCDNTHPGEIEVAATFLCMSGLMVDSELCQQYPSVIAAAAIRNAVLLLRKKDVMKHLQLCPMYKAAENKASPGLTDTCAILRRAVRTIANPIYEYKAPLEHYGQPPQYIAQLIVSAAHQ